MDIKVLGSGSKGNCYLIDDGSTSLLLECGIPIKRIREGLGFRLSMWQPASFPTSTKTTARLWRTFQGLGYLL